MSDGDEMMDVERTHSLEDDEHAMQEAMHGTGDSTKGERKRKWHAHYTNHANENTPCKQ